MSILKIKTNKQKRYAAFLGLLERFDAAARAYEMRGSQRPEDVPLIEDEYRGAKAALSDFVQRNIQ